jgi:hypothetical protein
MVWLIAPAAPSSAQEAGGPAVSPGKPQDEPKPQEEPGRPVPVAASDLSSLNRLLPIGKTARKVTVPTVDEAGRLTSVVTMGSITRIDEDQFELEKVVLTSFDHGDDEGTATVPEKTVITLITARYHAPTRVLVSDRPVTVRKPNLLLKGDSLHYDSASGRSFIKGHSLLLISDAPAAGEQETDSGGSEKAQDEAEDENENEDRDEDENEDEDEDEDKDKDEIEAKALAPNQEGAPSATAPMRP